MANWQIESCNNLWVDQSPGMANWQIKLWNNLWADQSQGTANLQEERERDDVLKCHVCAFQDNCVKYDDPILPSTFPWCWHLYFCYILDSQLAQRLTCPSPMDRSFLAGPPFSWRILENPISLPPLSHSPRPLPRVSYGQSFNVLECNLLTYIVLRVLHAWNGHVEVIGITSIWDPAALNLLRPFQFWLLMTTLMGHK